MINFLKPAEHKARISNSDIEMSYTQNRIKVFIGIFVGYAGYYLVRKNFSLAIPELLQEGYTKGQLGIVLSAIAISYGLSKLLMGSISDRSNAKYFLPLGLLLSAIVTIVIGVFPWATSSITIMFVLMLLNGWLQGMGWPACGRTMVHWFSIKERGAKIAFWNIAHNIGGGLIGPLAIAGLYLFGDWHSLFYFPAIIVLVVVVVVFLLMRDTPQSEGLPPIEEYKQEDYENYSGSTETELNSKDILFNNVLNNKMLWYIAFANAFVYLIRFGVIDWAPTYLSEVKGFTAEESSWTYFAYEYAGIPGTILSGYLSDKVFKGKRAPVSIIYLVLVLIALCVYWLAPSNFYYLDTIALISIGFLIYGPVMLIGLHALDLAPKKAAGTAAGLTGLFGYVGGVMIANIAIGYLVDNFGWDSGFILLIGAGVLAILFLLLTLNHQTPKNE
ncbi:MAG: glycerol-3-phosphate transporter [Flavobacteriales bacterium]|nr:glycerol-3-phosphate transporter [Flavobacteriales bacterium]